MNVPTRAQLAQFIRASETDVEAADWDDTLEACSEFVNTVFAGSEFDDPDAPYPSGHEAMDNAAAEEFLVHASAPDKARFLELCNLKRKELTNS